MNEENKEITPVEPVVEPVQESTLEQVPVEEPVVQTEPAVEPVNTVNIEKPKKKKPILLIILLLLLIAGIIAAIIILKPFDKKKDDKKVIDTPKEIKSDYRMMGNSLSAFDLYFLKLNNNEKNMVYSPLSIKYALEMLAEGTKGETKAQLDAVIGDYKAKKYQNSSNMSFANAFFVRNSFKDAVKEAYLDTLTTKYGAEVIYDSFESPKTINDWISNKTFNLINDLVDDVKQNDFVLVNALAIDMQWKNLLHCASYTDRRGTCLNEFGYYVEFLHEKLQGEDDEYVLIDYPYTSETQFPALTFDGKENKKSAPIHASFNRYNAVKEIGEEKIKADISKAYPEWVANSDEGRYMMEHGEVTDVNVVIKKYIEELDKNYGKEQASTDFMLYTDDNVKVFAKDLQTYNGTTLQYVGIMPTKETLKEFIHNSTSQTIQQLINSTKELKIENFADGYVTIIEGKIPMFNYNYELDLKEDLKQLGINDVFNIEKANLGNMLTSDHGEVIDKAKHKATIEFSNEGIKASAASMEGGLGNTGEGFNYLYEVPTIRIDMTFDKPYLYLIRDKDTDEVWFVGSVYDPITRSTIY